MALKINFILIILKCIDIIMNQKDRDKCQNLNTSVNAYHINIQLKAGLGGRQRKLISISKEKF